MSVAVDNPPPPSQVNDKIPPALSELVMKLLAKDPTGRPASAQLVLKSLQAIEKDIQAGKVAPVGPQIEPSIEVIAPAPKPDAKQPTAQGRISPRRRNSGLLIGLAATTAAILVAGGIILLWETPQGTVRIETSDPDTKVSFGGFNNGEILQGDKRYAIKLRKGDHAMHVQHGDLEFDTDKFVVKKGDTVTLKVELLPGKVQVLLEGKVIGSRNVQAGGNGASPAGPPIGGAQANRDPLRSIEGWGDVIDPDGDCQIKSTGDKTILQVPGTLHDLQAPGLTNSPRVLQDVDGDFVAQVKVANVIRSQIGTKAPNKKGGVFRSGTLLIWSDSQNFIRLDRASKEAQGKIVTLCWLEVYQNGKSPFGEQPGKNIVWYEEVPDKITLLRLERRQGNFNAVYSQDDGRSWLPVVTQPFPMNLPPRVKVGVSRDQQYDQAVDGRV